VQAVIAKSMYNSVIDELRKSLDAIEQLVSLRDCFLVLKVSVIDPFGNNRS